jgi:hypothetical protein
MFNVTQEIIADNNSYADANNFDDSVGVKVRTKASLCFNNDVNKLVIV